MKNNNSFSVTIIYIVLVLIALSAGTKIATLAYRFEPVVGGILGAADLCFMYLLFIRRSTSVSRLFDPHVVFPKDIKYVFLTLLVYMIVYWSARQIIDALLYIRDLVTLNM